MGQIFEQLDLPTSAPLNPKTVTNDRTALPALQVYRGLTLYDTSAPAGVYVYTGADATNQADSWDRVDGGTGGGGTGDFVDSGQDPDAPLTYISGMTLAEAQTVGVDADTIFEVDVPDGTDTVPIGSGGTNANNAVDALSNLGGQPIISSTNQISYTEDISGVPLLFPPTPILHTGVTDFDMAVTDLIDARGTTVEFATEASFIAGTVGVAWHQGDIAIVDGRTYLYAGTDDATIVALAVDFHNVTIDDEQTARLNAIVAEDADAVVTGLAPTFPASALDVGSPTTTEVDIYHQLNQDFIQFNSATRWDQSAVSFNITIHSDHDFQDLNAGDMILLLSDIDNYYLGPLRSTPLEAGNFESFTLSTNPIHTRGVVGSTPLSIYRSSATVNLDDWHILLNGGLSDELLRAKRELAVGARTDEVNTFEEITTFDESIVVGNQITFSDGTTQNTAADNVPDGIAIPINSDADMITVGSSVYLRSGVIETDLAVYPDATVNREYVFENNIVNLVDGGLGAVGSFPVTVIVGSTGERVYALYSSGSANQPSSIGVFNASTPRVFTPISAFSSVSFSSITTLLGVSVSSTDRITITDDELNILYFRNSTNILYNLTMTTAGDLSTLALGSQFDMDTFDPGRYTSTLSWNLDGTLILTYAPVSGFVAEIAFQHPVSTAYDLTTLTQSNSLLQIQIPAVTDFTVLSLSYTSTGLIAALAEFSDNIKLYIQISGNTYTEYALPELGVGGTANFSLSGDYLYVEGASAPNIYQQFLVQDFVGLKSESVNSDVNEAYYIKVQ